MNGRWLLSSDIWIQVSSYRPPNHFYLDSVFLFSTTSSFADSILFINDCTPLLINPSPNSGFLSNGFMPNKWLIILMSNGCHCSMFSIGITQCGLKYFWQTQLFSKQCNTQHGLAGRTALNLWGIVRKSWCCFSD